MNQYCKLDEIVTIATQAHRSQFRRDGVTPYITHCYEVARRVEGDELAEMVAWLHDYLEDEEFTKGSVEALRAHNVNPDVIRALELLNHPKWEPYREYLIRVKSSPLATKVKIADMLANLSDSPTERQIKKYAKGLLFLLDSNAETENNRPPKSQLNSPESDTNPSEGWDEAIENLRSTLDLAVSSGVAGLEATGEILKSVGEVIGDAIEGIDLS